MWEEFQSELALQTVCLIIAATNEASKPNLDKDQEKNSVRKGENYRTLKSKFCLLLIV